MSSTNHTTNYNLPQFIGSDKPAWLGDINPAMSAIDAQMKLNADAASAASGAAATADGKAVAAGNAASTADGKAETAQTTANGAVTRINALEQALNLSNIQSVTWDGFEPFVTLRSQFTDGYGNLYLAQNSDGSIFKLYGTIIYKVGNQNVTTPNVAVPGLTGIYGFKTMQLISAPDEAYIISSAGSYRQSDANYVKYAGSLDIAVGTDGYIYINITGAQSGIMQANIDIHMWFSPCIYFNKNFGDQPQQ